MGAVVSSSPVVSGSPSSSGEDSSHSAPALAGGPTHGRQLSMKFASMSPSHGVLSFRNRLLQRGSPTESQALPANLLRRGFLSPWGHRFWQEPAPARAPHGVTASFGHSTAPAWGPAQAAGGDLLHVNLHGLQGDNLLHCALLHGLQGNLLQHLEHLLPLLLHCPWWLQSCFSRIFSLLFPAAAAQGFFPLPKYVIPEALPWLLMGSALASGGSVLEPVALALSDIREGSSSFSQNPLL